MAQKEATVYILDCGSTMGERSHGRKDTNLDWALQYVWDKIITTVATGRKTALAAVVGLRTDGTENIMSAEEDYQNIAVFCELGQILMPQIRKLRSQLVVSNTQHGDAISALVVAIQMIANTCKQLKYDKKIVLVTDAKGAMQSEDLSPIAAKIKHDGIKLVVLGVDFDDAGYGFKEEQKDSTKEQNEAILKQLCEDCNGTFGTLAQATDELHLPRIRSVKPVTSYAGFLTLGNPEEYETALAINVERYPKVMIASPPSATQYVFRHGDASQSTATLENGESGEPIGDGLAAVKNARTYQVDDAHAPGGKREVDRDDLSKGYEYGRTAVHISESDRNVTTYETQAGLDIVGFVDNKQYERYLDMSRSCLIIAQRNNDKASMALSSLIHALYELESHAVARLVKKENTEPRMLLLTPNIEPDFECLYDVELPFAEDWRSFVFPPLDRIVTVNGKLVKVHRNLPSDHLLDAMSDYVDRMDLSNFAEEEDSQSAEYAPLEDTYSPMLHHVNQVIRHRAIYPDDEPPGPSDILTKYSRPSRTLLQRANPALERVIAAADVKKVPPKARGKRFGRKEAPKPRSDLDVNALLAQDPKRTQKRIDPKNAVPEFKQLIEQASEESLDLREIESACKQLKNVIFGWIRHSVGDSSYGKAIEAIRVMREQVVEMEMPEVYNDFLRELKDKLKQDELGEGRREMWWLVRTTKLYLISTSECEASKVRDEDAKAFMTFNSS